MYIDILPIVKARFVVYIGLRFDISGQKHYGWAEVSTKEGPLMSGCSVAAAERADSRRTDSWRRLQQIRKTGPTSSWHLGPRFRGAFNRAVKS